MQRKANCTHVYNSLCIECSRKLEAKRKSPVFEVSIHRALRAELAEAMAEALQATEAFSRVTTDIPSGLPHQDGAQRIHNVSRQLSHARQRMMLAHKRLADYLVTGKAPEDLKRSG